MWKIRYSGTVGVIILKIFKDTNSVLVKVNSKKKEHKPFVRSVNYIFDNFEMAKSANRDWEHDERKRKKEELAIKKKTGARGLRSIIESAMQKVMFDVPDMTSAKKVVVTADCVEGKADALVYGTRNKKIA